MFGMKSQAFWHKNHSSSLIIGTEDLFYEAGDRNYTVALI